MELVLCAGCFGLGHNRVKGEEEDPPVPEAFITCHSCGGKGQVEAQPPKVWDKFLVICPGKLPLKTREIHWGAKLRSLVLTSPPEDWEYALLSQEGRFFRFKPNGHLVPATLQEITDAMQWMAMAQRGEF